LFASLHIYELDISLSLRRITLNWVLKIIIANHSGTSVIPALKRLGQEDCEFKDSLGYMVSSKLPWPTLVRVFLKNKTNKSQAGC
jgi:hypothetical protein